MLTINITQKEDLSLLDLAELVGMGAKSEVVVPYEDEKALVMFTKSLFAMLLNKHSEYPGTWRQPCTVEIMHVLNPFFIKDIDTNCINESGRGLETVERRIGIDDALIEFIEKWAEGPFDKMLTELNLQNLEKENGEELSSEVKKKLLPALQWFIRKTPEYW